MKKILFSYTLFLCFSLQFFAQDVPQEFLDAINIVDDGKPLPVPELIDGAATVKGQIAGYSSEMKIEIQFYVSDPAINSDKVYSCKVNGDGTFNIKLPLISSSLVMTEVGDLFIHNWLLSPQKETIVYIDLAQNQDGSRQLYFSGANAELNNQLTGSEYGNYISKYGKSITEDISGMTAIQYRDYLYTREKERLDDIDQLNFTKKMKELLQIDAKCETFRYLYMGYHHLKEAYKKSNNGKTDGYEEPVFDEEYYAYIKDFPFSDLKSLYYPMYRNLAFFTSRLDKGIDVTSKQIHSVMLDSVIKQPFYDSKYDDVIKFYRKNTFEGIAPDKLEQYVQRYSVVLKALRNSDKLTPKALRIADRILAIDKINTEKEFVRYNNMISSFRYYTRKLLENDELLDQLKVEPLGHIMFSILTTTKDSLFNKKEKEFKEDENVKNYFNNWYTVLHLEDCVEPFHRITGINKGLSWDCLLMQSIAKRFDEMTPFSQSDLNFYRNYFDNPFFIKYLTLTNDDLLTQIRENKEKVYSVHQVPDIAEDRLLHEILKPFEGKVIFIDFWNTWCGPCLQAMKEFAETKESYKGKDVAFIYLADESSPEVAWNNMIASIGGEHFRLTKEQMDHLKVKFGFNGIPSYAIFNKKGEQVYFRSGFEGAKKISEIIDKHLKE